MALRGCINVDRLPLQILLNDNRAWKGTPVAVTRDEKPQSPILALNREAREKGLSAGMKYASALSMVPSLRAREVPPDRIAEARARIVRRLLSFTPDIEPCPFDADALWASVDGLRSLFGSESRWITMVRDALAADGFRANVVVGFTRFGTYVIARSRPRSLVFASRNEEYAHMSRSSIDILPLPLRVKGTLRKLDVRTVRQFVALPPGETERRLGKEAGRLRRAILSDDPLPIQSAPVKETMPCRRRLDAPPVDLDLLMPHIDELLAIETGRVEAERSVISALTLVLRTEDGEITTDTIRPAVPTLGAPVFRRLLLLRLSSRHFSSGVQDIEIRSARTAPSHGQEELFAARSRDLKAGARAFAAIRARFGDESVTCARLSDSYLPERSFRWVPIERPKLPAPNGETADAEHPAAVRRILFAPARVKPGPGMPDGRAEPFVVSGSWWGAGAADDAPYLREYFFDDSPAGIHWFFVDRITGASWVQGAVD